MNIKIEKTPWGITAVEEYRKSETEVRLLWKQGVTGIKMEAWQTQTLGRALQAVLEE